MASGGLSSFPMPAGGQTTHRLTCRLRHPRGPHGASCDLTRRAERFWPLELTGAPRGLPPSLRGAPSRQPSPSWARGARVITSSSRVEWLRSLQVEDAPHDLAAVGVAVDPQARASCSTTKSPRRPSACGWGMVTTRSSRGLPSRTRCNRSPRNSTRNRDHRRCPVQSWSSIP
jgi:hypothetical protein